MKEIKFTQNYLIVAISLFSIVLIVRSTHGSTATDFRYFPFCWCHGFCLLFFLIFFKLLVIWITQVVFFHGWSNFMTSLLLLWLNKTNCTCDTFECNDCYDEMLWNSLDDSSLDFNQWQGCVREASMTDTKFKRLNGLVFISRLFILYWKSIF